MSSASLSDSEDSVLCVLIQTEAEAYSKIQVIQIHLLVSRVNFLMYCKTKAVNNCMLRAAGIDATRKMSELHHRIPDTRLSIWYV